MKNFILFVFFLFAIARVEEVYAYPNFIGHGYNSCITCHYNPFGNGPINDYGRAVAATAIASRNFHSIHKPEEQLAKDSGFFFKPSDPASAFRPFIGYRGMLLKRNLGDQNETSEWINMQLDGNIYMKLGQNDKFGASYTFGYAPIPRALKNSPAANKMDEYRTREHYLAYRPTQSLGIYVGLMDKPYGIRLVEHNMYSRSVPQLTMNDQAHGVTVHYLSGNFEGGMNYFVGNMAQEDALRQKGFAGTFEYTLMENFRPGMSILASENQYLKLTSMAMHLRSSLGNTGSIMSEIGTTSKTVTKFGTKTDEMYGFIQAHLKANRGLYVLNSMEYYSNSDDKSYKIRFGPSLQYFPVNRVELRFDLYNTRTFSEVKSRADVWDFLGQLHLWF